MRARIFLHFTCRYSDFFLSVSTVASVLCRAIPVPFKVVSPSRQKGTGKGAASSATHMWHPFAEETVLRQTHASQT